MHRFFIPPDCIGNTGRVRFPKETTHQIRRVLRLKTENQVIVLDNQGNEFQIRLTRLGDQEGEGEIIEKRNADGEPFHQISLYLSLSQRQKFEWTLQKCTEIGINNIIPMVTSRCLVQDKEDNQKRIARWQRILQEAAEQSGRGLIPGICPPFGFKQAIETIQQSDVLGILFWEKEKALRLKEFLKGVDPKRKIGLVIGPEGGFSEDEVRFADENGIQSVSLGRRILRMETAAIVASALVFYELGEMKPDRDRHI